MIFMAGKGHGGPPIPSQRYGRGWYKPGVGRWTDMGFVYGQSQEAYRAALGPDVSCPVYPCCGALTNVSHEPWCPEGRGYAHWVREQELRRTCCTPDCIPSNGFHKMACRERRAKAEASRG